MSTYLSKEQRVVILASRVSFNEENEREWEELLKEELDWYQTINYSIRNRVSLLLFHQLKKRGMLQKISKRWAEPLYFHYLGTQKRNEAFLSELDTVMKTLSTHGIQCTPLKGGYLIGHVYKDSGIRIVHDMDCMIRKEDTRRLDQIMKSMGYCQGEYDEKSKTILPISREKEIIWKTKMNNLFPYKKVKDSVYCDHFIFDFCFSLDYDLRTEPVNEMLNRAVTVPEKGGCRLMPYDFFIHLCCHLYKEAVNPLSIVMEKDINLIKFCDVREYVLQEMGEASLHQAVMLAKEYHYEKALYFTLYYLKQLYQDGYEQPLLDQLEIEDEAFMHRFGERDYGQAIEWKKTFYERLFAMHNKDELISEPKLLKID